MTNKSCLPSIVGHYTTTTTPTTNAPLPEFRRPSDHRVRAFKAALLAEGSVTVSVRTTRGLQAAAACGQLRNQFQKNAVAAGGVATG